MDISNYKKIDTILFNISRKLKFLGYLEALNSQDQKEKFLRGQVENPKFIYKKLQYNPTKIKDELQSLHPPTDEIGELQRKVKKELYLRNKILMNLGKKKKMIKLSSILYGIPNNALNIKAKSILEKKENDNQYDFEDKRYTPYQLIKFFQSFFKRSKLKQWNVSLSRQHSVSVASTQKTLKLSPFKKYSENDKQRLIVHEIQGHIFRSENGYNQPLSMFATGLSNFLPTEEGITTLLEENAGLRTIQLKKRYALRVLATKELRQGKTFRECFDFIKRYINDDQQAWEITYRVYRGGGFIKDHLYLKGYLLMKEFLKHGGNVVDLYIGKIGIHHIEITKSLRNDKILNAPKFLPDEEYI